MPGLLISALQHRNVLICFLLLVERASSHIFLRYPHTRAKCFYEYPLSVTDDSIFRGNPCGRTSRGVQTQLSSNATLSLAFRMTVAHMSAFQLSIGPGIAGTGGKTTGAPVHTSYDSTSTVLASFNCSHLPGGCQSDPQGRGDYCLPISLPALPTGVYTLQLRQFAPEFNYNYYDCADIRVDNVGDTGGPNCQHATFTAVAYPYTIYVLDGFLFGIPGMIAIFVLLYDLYWMWRWGDVIYGENVSDDKPDAEQSHHSGEEPAAVACLDGDSDESAASGSHSSEDQKNEAPTIAPQRTRTLSAFCVKCWHVAASRRGVITSQLLFFATVFLVMFGIDASLRNCSLQTYPEF